MFGLSLKAEDFKKLSEQCVETANNLSQISSNFPLRNHQRKPQYTGLAALPGRWLNRQKWKFVIETSDLWLPTFAGYLMIKKGIEERKKERG